MNLIEHTLLTLDFWQDNVTYEGKSMPTGTLACAALNLSDEVIVKLYQLCMPLNLYMGSLQLGQANTAQMEAARESTFQIVELLRNVPPFSYLEYEIVHSYVDSVFSEDYLQNTMDFKETLTASPCLKFPMCTSSHPRRRNCIQSTSISLPRRRGMTSASLPTSCTT